MPGEELQVADGGIVNGARPAVRKSIVIAAGGPGIMNAISAREYIEKNIPAVARGYIRWVCIDTADIRPEPQYRGGIFRFPSDTSSAEEWRMLYLRSPLPDDLSPDFLSERYKNDKAFNWLPDPGSYDISAGEGSKPRMTRPLGRLALFHAEKEIREALEMEKGRLSELPDDPEIELMDMNRAGNGEAGFESGPRISVFITASLADGAGSGMFLDLAAMVRDIFSAYLPGIRVYGVLLLPSRYGCGAHDRNGGGNAYAALKEIDYFMSGNSFRAIYPGGRRVDIRGPLFDEGGVYLLDTENMTGNSLTGSEGLSELAGSLISTFIAAPAGGVIEDKTAGAPACLPEGERSPRLSCYRSFGISRAVYPVQNLKNIGYRVIASGIIDSFLAAVDEELLLETAGDINSGLARMLRLNCRLLFERIYPGYKADIAAVKRSLGRKFEDAGTGGDVRSIYTLMDSVISDYGREGMERMKRALLVNMERRYMIEIDKMHTLLMPEIRKYISDPRRGFNFAAAAVDLLLAKLDTYSDKYYMERTALESYSVDDMERLRGEAEDSGGGVAEYADAVIRMAAFNYSQMVFDAMLSSAEVFIRRLRSLLFRIKNMEINAHRERLTALRKRFCREIGEERCRILGGSSPQLLYLVDKEGIDSFVEKYFSSKLPVDDIRREADFAGFKPEEDTLRVVETYLVATEGVSILGLNGEALRSTVAGQFGPLLGKPAGEVRRILFKEMEHQLTPVQAGERELPGYDIELMRKNLFRIIYSKLSKSCFDNIPAGEIFSGKDISLPEVRERLARFSTPGIFIDPAGLGPVKYCRFVRGLGHNTQVKDEERPDFPGGGESLPGRISVETTELPDQGRPYEMISIGVLPGIPLFKINSLEESAGVYHELVMEKGCPLHIFNSPEYDAKYFPDPLGHNNYMNPAKLWSGLILLKVLEENNGVYSFEENIHGMLKDVEAREGYGKVVLDIGRKISGAGGYDEISSDLLAEALNGLGMMAKNPADGRMQFRREYFAAIMDILDRSGNWESVSRDEYEKHAEPPQFADTGELVSFLEGERGVREFIINSVKSVIGRTGGNIKAGADIAMPKWKVEQAVLPVFDGRPAFYQYYAEHGSLEWQNILKERLTEKLNDYVSSARFRLESDPSLSDRAKIREFLRSLEQRMPGIVLWEVKVKNMIPE